VVALLALNLQFTPDIQQPLSSYEVSLVSLPASKATTPSGAKAKTASKKARSKKAPSKPQEKPLPPLTTKMASERLSESLPGAAKSVVVPDKLVHQAPADPPPVVKTSPGPPSALESIKQPSKANVKDALKEIKAPPKAPNLASVQPFTKTQELETTPSTHEPLSQSLKEKMQSIQVPSQPKKAIRTQKKRAKKKTPITPPPTPAAPRQKEELPPMKPRERLSDSLKQVLESVKVPQLRDVSKPDPVRGPTSELPSSKPVIPPRDRAASKKFRTEIDQQLAKLTVPEVAPIESIRTRLQIQEAPSESAESNQSGQTSQSSRNATGQNRYLALVQAHIDQQWVAPPVKAHEKNLQVVLKFRILRSGKVIDLDIAKGSGNSYYDSAALRAVQRANPLPPFPSDIRKFSFDVRYNFTLGEPSS
jgi:protein TonB